MAMSKEAVTLETSSDSVKDSLCVPCLDVGDHRQAVKFCIDCAHLICQNCVDCHRRFKQMKEHKLVEISATEDLKLSQKLSNLLICPNHPDKTVELVCKNHDVLCCLTCATVSHRGCQSVVELAKEALDLKQTESAGDLKTHLTAAKDHMTSIVRQHEKCKEACITTTEEMIPKKLQELKQNLIQAFAVMEGTIRTELARKGFMIGAKHDEEKAKWEKGIKLVEEAISLMSSVQQNGSPTHVYIVAHKLQKIINEVDTAIANQGRKVQTRNISLEVGFDLQKVLSSKPNRLADLNVTDTFRTLVEYKFPQNDTDCKQTGREVKCPLCNNTFRVQGPVTIWKPAACSSCGHRFYKA